VPRFKISGIPPGLLGSFTGRRLLLNLRSSASQPSLQYRVLLNGNQHNPRPSGRPGTFKFQLPIRMSRLFAAVAKQGCAAKSIQSRQNSLGGNGAYEEFRKLLEHHKPPSRWEKIRFGNITKWTLACALVVIAMLVR
jgi:hypothetical protein